MKTSFMPALMPIVQLADMRSSHL